MARDRRSDCHPDGQTRLIRRLARSWRARVAVVGHSMEPTLRDGEWLLVDPRAFNDRPPQPGQLVVAEGEPWLVKRVAATSPGALTLHGDHAEHTNEPIVIRLEQVRGRPWWRYWPLRRFGRIG